MVVLHQTVAYTGSELVVKSTKENRAGPISNYSPLVYLLQRAQRGFRTISSRHKAPLRLLLDTCPVGTFDYGLMIARS